MQNLNSIYQQIAAIGRHLGAARVKVYFWVNKQNKRGLPRMRQSSLIYPAYMASSYCAFTKVKLIPSSDW